MTGLRQKVVRGAFWTLLEKFSCQGVSFVVSMVLARLLTPDDYGTVALMAIFFAVANVLVDGGFGGALIQKKDADDLDFNSVFYLNVALSLVTYVVLFAAAPWIADFYKAPVLVPMVRVAAIELVFNAVNAVQNAELTKKMLFHLSFRISIVTSVTSATVGISLACMGYGAWALVWASLVAGLAGVIARWFVIAWRPRLLFSFRRLRPLFAYGWKMSVSGLLDRLFANLNGLLIGKFYSRADLAFVNKGNSLPELVMNQVDETLGRVSFPALVEMQDDRMKLRETMRRMMRCSTFLVFPLMVGVAACSRNLLLLCFGDAWVPATPYMMLACFSFALWPFSTINLRGIMVLGRSDVFLKLEIVKKLAKLAVILGFFRLGVLPFMAACAFALGPLSLVINAWPNRKLLQYSLRMQIMDVLPTAGICVVEAAVVFAVGFLPFPLVLLILCQLVSGALTFAALAWLFRLEPAREYARMMNRTTLGMELAELRREKMPALVEDPMSIPCIETSDAARLCAKPLVSVLMITYNHEAFIRQAIEGVLMQKTDFDFELIIGEDCSTDRTREICFEYQRRHPDRIRVLWWHENVSRLGGNASRVRVRCRGEFVATCEGDDYWTDPHKLQKQVDILRKYPQVTLCSHHFAALTEKGLEDCTAGRIEELVRSGKDPSGFLFNRAEFLFPSLLSQMATVVYRREACDWEMIRKIGVSYDWILYYVILSKGPGYFINETMSVYRFMGGGSWSSMDQIQKIRWSLSRALRLYEADPTADSKRQRDDWIERLRHCCTPYREWERLKGILGRML